MPLGRRGGSSVRHLGSAPLPTLGCREAVCPHLYGPAPRVSDQDQLQHPHNVVKSQGKDLSLRVPLPAWRERVDLGALLWADGAVHTRSTVGVSGCSTAPVIRA